MNEICRVVVKRATPTTSTGDWRGWTGDWSTIGIGALPYKRDCLTKGDCHIRGIALEGGLPYNWDCLIRQIAL